MKEIQGISESEKSELVLSWQQIYRLPETEIFCTDFNLVQNYVKLCNVLHINVEVLACEICDNQPTKLCSDNMEYEWLSYDYAMQGSFYSCIVQEKELIDTIDKIELNKNGLLRDFDDTKKFADLRECAKKKYNGKGFEYGQAGADFHAIALFRCTYI